MKIYGIDFTSRPKRSKPITCLECMLDDDRLIAVELNEWHTFEEFEAALRKAGPWIAVVPPGTASWGGCGRGASHRKADRLL